MSRWRRCLHISYTINRNILVFEKKQIISYFFYINLDPQCDPLTPADDQWFLKRHFSFKKNLFPPPHQLWPHPSNEDRDYDKLKSTLFEVAFTNVTRFWWIGFENIFWKFVSIYSYVTIRSPIVARPTVPLGPCFQRNWIYIT